MFSSNDDKFLYVYIMKMGLYVNLYTYNNFNANIVTSNR